MSLIFPGAIGGWCWPDIFVRLFIARSVTAIHRSGAQAAPILLVFGFALSLLALLASSILEVSERPDDVWFMVAGTGGVATVALAGLCVLGATVGNVGANLQALGTQTANDIFAYTKQSPLRDARSAKIAVFGVTILVAAAASTTIGTVGLVALAQVSYQAIRQLAPALLLGVIWQRGNALSAALGVITASILQLIYPVSIPWAGGRTSGVIALAVNGAVYCACAFLVPGTSDERRRVARLFEIALLPDTATTPEKTTAPV
ncbi:hypothetical protein ASF48_07710 [Rathayibacter sp. Leaf299]|uniref:hypothetical protein n=1 Tax=Rathayibacter sp. Leaf299 TaxID=1736328 RepID=UPI0006FE1360|nr:hypothetical protein [Rathayibacter sp. Leaf299]KQQ20516.1 hypothetical protein ASF48_07710 [Rathayibacter sp. Leaf299]